MTGKLFYLSSLITFFFVITVSAGSQDPYFQQEVNYTIQVKLDDHNHVLTAYETIEYINNSPDTLEFIYLHLWPNAYKNTNTAFAKQALEDGSGSFYFAAENRRGYIDSLNFQSIGRTLTWEFHKEHIDICKVMLNEPLFPGDSVIISTPFKVKIPWNFSRLGHREQSYQISQWYPKPAVYDREGWHEMPYLDMGEFYSEYGSFNVEITLPRNYVVGATGNLQDPEEIAWLDKKAEETSKIEVFDSTDMTFPESSKEFKTLKYTESNIHDFAWFADKRYHVLKDSVYLENSDHWVTTWSMFTNQDARMWKKSPEYIKDAISYYSNWYYDYPYNHCTALTGGSGGMEYPTITLIGSVPSDLLLEEVIMHEVGHNWFYGILGFNERAYPYLDEGLNTFSESRYMNTKYKKQKMLYEEAAIKKKIATLVNIDDIPYDELSWIVTTILSRLNNDQPINLHSEKYTSMNYGLVYYKSAISYYYLMHAMGEDIFNRAMQDFFDQWKFKHPGPDDFQAALEDYSKMDLNWFFNELVSSTKKIDYKVCSAKSGKIKVRNTGQINSPVSITGYSGNNPKYQFLVPGFAKSKWIDLPEGKVDKIVINDIEIPELNKKNNSIKTSGIAKRLLPLEIYPVQVVEKEDKMQVGLLPAMGWNYYNKFMLGAIFYNPIIPAQKIEYQLVPMYAFGNKNLSGSGNITLHTFPAKTLFERVDFSLSAKRFGYGIDKDDNYNKLRAEAKMIIKKKEARSPVSQSLRLSYTGASDIIDILSDRTNQSTTIDFINFFNADYNLMKRSRLRPYSLTLSAEASEYSVKASGEFHFSVLNRRNKEAFRLRAFAGAFLDPPDNPVHAFRLSGTSGYTDYTYDYLFFGRFEEYGVNNAQQFFSQQFIRNEGGFASYSPLVARNWIISVSGEIKIPRIPAHIFLNLAGLGDPDDLVLPAETREAEKLAYETGLYLEISKFAHIYFPILFLKDIGDSLDHLTGNYWQKIRFSILLKDLNPRKIRDQIL